MARNSTSRRNNLRVGSWETRRSDGWPAIAWLSSPAPQLGQSGRGNRLLYESVPEHVEVNVGRLARTELAQRHAGAIQQSRSPACDRAAVGDLAFRLACHERAADAREVQEGWRDAGSAVHD